jgi:hypothetical protein
LFPAKNRILFVIILFYKYRSLGFENHTVELGQTTKTLLCRLVDEVGRSFNFVPRESDINPESSLCSCGENFLLVHHYALGVPTNWHTSCRGIKTFSGAVARKQASNTIIAITTVRHFSGTLRILKLAGLYHCEFFLYYRFAKHFSLFYFCLYCFSCFLSVFSLLILYTQSIKIVYFIFLAIWMNKLLSYLTSPMSLMLNLLIILSHLLK